MPIRSRRSAAKADGDAPKSATETVLEIIKGSPDGIGIAEIKEQTGYDDKKLRNIIFRLNKMERITRVNRGTYKVIE